MNYFTNYDQLVSHGCSEERKIALDCLNIALDAASTYQGTKQIITCDDSGFTAGDRRFQWEEVERLFVVGAGKGSFPIALALHEILGDHIAGGVVALKDFDHNPMPRIEMIRSGHPVPDEKSLQSGQKIAALAQTLTERDVVITCLTGGCSSLMVLPPEGIPFNDIQQVGRLLMRCGAPIYELNTVRKHTCLLKGGGLLKMLSPATVITLTQDTRPELLPWPDPVLADPSTFAGAIDVLKAYELWDETPATVQDYLTRGLSHPEMETPKSLEGTRHFMFDVGNQRNACEAAVRYARQQGYHAAVLSTQIEGEAREVGSAFAGIAKEIQRYGNPFSPPCVLLSSGETRVTVCNNPGEGGPNQEFAIGFAQNIRNYDHIVCASIDSEGTDGPTYIAGGITDCGTSERAREAGISIFDALRCNNSSPVLRRLEDAVITVPTGTNVVNLRVLVVRGADHE